MVINPNLANNLKGLPQRLRGFFVDGSQSLCCNESVEGGGDSNAVRQRVEPCQVGDRDYPAFPEVHLLPLPPSQKEPMRYGGRYVGGRSGQLTEEAGMLAGLPEN